MPIDYPAGEVITHIPESPAVTAGVKAVLAQALSGFSVHEILAKYPTPFALVTPLQNTLPEHTGAWGQIAIELHSFLANMVTQAPQQQDPAEPRESVLNTPTLLHELPTGELLRRLAAKKGDQRRLLEALMANSNVQAALQKTRAVLNTDAIIVPTTDGGIDIDATVRYIEHLALSFGQPVYKVDDVFPMTVDQALGLTRMVMFNFVTSDIVYVGQPDKFGMGLVLSDLPENLIKAGFWGLTVNHPFMFRSDNQAEQAKFFAQLFSGGPLPFEMQRVLEDYERALASGDIMAQAAIYQITEAQAEQLVNQSGGNLVMGGAVGGQSSMPEAIARHFGLA